MDLIYDVGAHQGEDTDFYLRKGFRVVAVEADPVLAARLRENFATAIDCGQLVVVEAAVADALFGEDLPGPWLAKAQAIREYAPLFLRDK